MVGCGSAVSSRSAFSAFSMTKLLRQSKIVGGGSYAHLTHIQPQAERRNALRLSRPIAPTSRKQSLHLFLFRSIFPSASLSEGRQPVTPIDGAGGKRSRRTGKRSRSGRRQRLKLARRLRVRPRQPAPGRRRGSARGTMPPARSWLHVGRGAFAGKDARPGMGRYRSPAKEANPRSATSAARRREPAPDVRATPPTRDLRANAAMERRKARRPRYGRSSLARTCRRWALPRGGPWVRPDHAHQRLPALHPPRIFRG